MAIFLCGFGLLLLAGGTAGLVWLDPQRAMGQVRVWGGILTGVWTVAGGIAFGATGARPLAWLGALGPTLVLAGAFLGGLVVEGARASSGRSGGGLYGMLIPLGLLAFPWYRVIQLNHYTRRPPPSTRVGEPGGRGTYE